MAPPGGELTSCLNSEWSITLNSVVFQALCPPIGNFSRRRRRKEKFGSYWPVGFAAGRNENEDIVPKFPMRVKCVWNGIGRRRNAKGAFFSSSFPWVADFYRNSNYVQGAPLGHNPSFCLLWFSKLCHIIMAATIFPDLQLSKQNRGHGSAEAIKLSRCVTLRQ